MEDANSHSTGRIADAWSWTRMPLRARLILVVIVCVVPLVAFTIERQYADYQDTVAAAGRQTLELTRGISLAVEYEVQARIAALQVLALSRQLRDGNIDGFRAQADMVVAEQFPGSNILLVEENGRQHMNTDVPHGAQLPVRPELHSVSAVFSTGRPAVSDMFRRALGGTLAVSIDVPVKDADGHVIYALVMNPPLHVFADVIARARIPKGWVMSVFDRQGVNVARNLSPERFVGERAGAVLLQRMRTEREGTFSARSREGLQLVSAFAQVEPFGWAVAAGVPLSSLTGPAEAAALRTLAAGGAALAAGLILALLVLRQITGPMAVLRRLAVAAGRNEIFDPQPTGLREADEVAEALHAAEMQRRRSEHEVRERNAQLAAANQTLEAEIVVRRQAEQRAEAQLARLNLLHQITRAIGERQDLASIFQVVVRALEDQLPVDFACLCLYDSVAQTLTVSRVGTKSETLASDLALPERACVDIDENGLSRCVRGEVVYEADIGAVDYPFPRRLASGGLRALVVAPLQAESQVFGVLVAARRQPRSFISGECEFLRQLSEHVALAAHQAQLYGALERAYEDLRQTQQAIMQQERLRVLGQMASGIAHDINNALAPITLYLDSLLETAADLPHNARGYLEIIRRAVDDVAQTVARMREFYRQREPQLTSAPVALNELITQVVDLTRARWNDMPMQRGAVVRVRTDLAADLPPIMGVESEIREALINLVLNAVDALPSGGTVVLRTRAIGEPVPKVVQVDVADDGVGMDEDTRRRCLEPFFTTKGERGTGLGLAMVYGIAQRHGADIEIASEQGKGTTVRLSFPIPAAVAARPAAAGAGAVSRRLRLLVVDDDPLVLRSLCHILERDGHVVVTANDGEAGIAAFRAAQGCAEAFDAIITDLGMPNVDGRKVAEAVKAASPATPVILLTGWGQRLLSDDDIPPHVDHVLSKPPRLHELREALVRCCQASGV